MSEDNTGNGLGKNTIIGAVVAIALGLFTSYCAPVTIHFINKAMEMPSEEVVYPEEAPAEEEEAPRIAGLCYTDKYDPGCPAMPGKNYCDPEEWVCTETEEEATQ